MLTSLFEDLEISTKKCSKCGIDQPLEKFTKSSGANYLRAECRDCERKLGRERQRIKNSVVAPGPKHQCPICQRGEEQVRGRGGKKSGVWCCDHDHEEGKFRGWLCHDCNRALGAFKDNLEIMKRAMEYLEKHDPK